jgi:hypothetical protein
MRREQMLKAPPRYVGRDYGAYYHRRWWTTWTDFVFEDPAFVSLLQTDRERKKLPRGAEFVEVKIGRRQITVLRIPKDKFQDLEFSWRLNRRFSARENGFAASKRRKETLAQQNYYHTRADLRVLWRIQRGRCYYTGEPLGEAFETARFHVEHIEPLDRGGHDGPTNLALVTALANARKRNRSKCAFLKRWPPTPAVAAEMSRVDRERAAAFSAVDRKKESRVVSQLARSHRQDSQPLGS